MQTTTKTEASTAVITQDQEEDTRWDIGECISYDNVGPISPESSEGYKQFLSFGDTRSKSQRTLVGTFLIPCVV